MVKNSYRPIGIFDSGLGGLTVVKAVKRVLQNEDIIYFGDTAHVPYGTKSKEAIVRFSIENAKILLKHDVKCIVVACNSSSSYALKVLKKEFKVPILGVIDPGVKKAVDVTVKKRIGVIATQATIESDQYAQGVRRINKTIRVFNQACPLFVPLVEEGWANKRITQDVIKEYLAPVLRKNIDTLILGCTHYPLLKSAIRKYVGKEIVLVDSATEVAQKIKMMIKSSELEQNIRESKGKLKLFVSDKPQAFKKQAKQFLGCNIGSIKTIN